MIKPLFIGVDPAFRRNGFAICIIDDTKEVCYKTFHSVVDYIFFINNLDAYNTVVVCIENSNMQPEIFDKKPTKKEQIEHARNIGKNQATSQIIYEYTKRLYASTTFQVSPKQKGAKPNLLQSRKMLEGYRYKALPANQDEMDALLLATIAVKFYYKKS
jgi:hypothetical protein